MRDKLNRIADALVEYYNKNNNWLSYEDMIKNDTYFKSLVMQWRQISNLLSKFAK